MFANPFLFNKSIQYGLIISLFSFLFVGCGLIFPQRPLVDPVTVNVDFSIDGLSGAFPAGSYVLLLDESNSVVASLPADTARIYTFTGIGKQYPTQVYRTYTVGFFVDSNANKTYDKGLIAESATFAECLSIDMQRESSASEVYIKTKALLLSGTLTLHADWGTLNNYIYCKNSFETSGKLVSISAGGQFSFYEGEKDNGSSYEIYAFHDTDLNCVFDPLHDLVAYLMTQGPSSGNGNLTLSIHKVSGTISRSAGTIGTSRFDFGSANPPILKVIDRSFYKSFFVKPQDSLGNYSVYCEHNHSLELLIYHISFGIPSSGYNSMFQDYLMFPTRLVTMTYLVSTDQTLNQTLYTITVKIQNPSFNYPGKKLFVNVDVGWCADDGTVPLYTNETTPATGAQDSIGTNYIFYFRNSAASFQIRAFIDLNGDGSLSPEDPRSGYVTFGTPYDNMDCTGTSLSIAAP